MTAPASTELTGICARCGGEIRHLSGPSWRHVRRIRDIGSSNHPADPDQTTREQSALAAAAAH